MRERQGLIARVQRIRRVAARAEAPATSTADGPSPDPLRALEARVAHLEKLLQGLQDSVYRESTRQSRRIAELEARVNPVALQKALSEDARERGL